jgi:hypothetical protein
MHVADVAATRNVRAAPRAKGLFPIVISDSADGFADEMAATHDPFAIHGEASFAAPTWLTETRVLLTVERKGMKVTAKSSSRKMVN